MNILLTAINAKYIHSNLAVYSLQAYAGEYRDQISIGEFTINNSSDHILEAIYRQEPDVLCFSVYIWNLDYVENVSREFHKLFPQVPIWVGGPEVSYRVEEFLQEHPWITGVMIGEGEQTFKEVCGYYISGGTEKDEAADEGVAYMSGELEKSVRAAGMPDGYLLDRIDGIAFRRGGDIVVTSPRKPIDMSTIPFAYRNTEDFSNRIIYYESSRGCPFSCSYCLSSVDKHLRFRNTELVKKELQFFIDRKVPQIKFVDRTFNCNHKHAQEIWRYIMEHDNGVTNFHFEIAADLLNEEELDLIGQMRPGLIQLEIGVQSTNDDTIREIHRTMKLDQLKAVVNRIHAGGNIHQHLDLIAGLPEEDYDSFRTSFNEIYALKPNQLQLGFLKVLKGSYMYDHAREYEIQYHDQPPYEVLSTKWMDYGTILRLKRVEEMVEVYYNSGQYEITMKLLECIFRQYGKTPFDLYQSLGDFYDTKGYFGMSHSRIRRCQILLEFFGPEGQALWLKSEPQSLSPQCNGAGNSPQRKNEPQSLSPQLIYEALTFDLYYRENCKSRPDWAPDPSTFKRITKAYCKNGKLSHVEPFHYIFPDKEQLTLETLPEYLEEPVWVRFSYDRRDPLDHQAYREYLSPTEEEKGKYV